MKASDNKYLKVGRNVVLTPTIEPVICALDSYFEKHQTNAWVTSGLRDSEHQLNIIRGYLASKGLDKTYRDTIEKGLNDMISFDGKQVYAWQPGWSALLNAGIIINPPLEAELLMDYVGKTGKNRKGDKFQPTVHIKGTAFDIGGGADGISGDASNELAIVQEALNEKKIPGLVDIVIEHNNNCVHCDCK